MTKDKTLKIANDIAIGVDVTKDGTHVIAMRLRPDGVNVVMYSQFHPLEQPEQEPVAWMDEFGNVFPLGAQRGPKHLNEPMKPLYTTPPQRTWVGLTDDEIRKAKHHMVDGAYHYSFKQGAEWAEAKLKEKNT